ncbi:MAG: oligoendopeptidase F family protein, partial [Lachnospiraceae bacterium]|nr:oligoendopeptidase F family protein [Lachnospiraceae bacterium]
MAKELIKRSEVKVEDTWAVEDLYKTKADWEKDLENAKNIAEELSKTEGHVCDSAKSLLNVLEKQAELEEKLDYAYSYASRLSDQDTANTEHQSMVAKVFSLYSETGAKLAFIEPEILALSDEATENFIKEEKGLELYRRQLEMLAKKRPHTLSTEMEKLLAMTMEMAATAEDTYGILDNANMIYPEIKDENGEEVRITTGRFIPFLESADRRVREDAFKNYYETYKQFINTYASLYNGQVKQQCFYTKARKYASNLERAVSNNEVPTVVYHNLINTVNKNVDKLHRYVRLRKKLLNLPELHMYDVYTPIIGDVARTYTFDEAMDICLKALEPMGEDYVAMIKEGFDNRWIDKYENQGKRGGAYSAGAYGCHPFVLMNFNGSLDNVFTLIHEMGHSIHSYLSNKNQPFIYSQYKIFVAEVASTCNEVLLLEYLLK